MHLLVCVYVCVYTVYVYDGVGGDLLWLLTFLHSHHVRSPFICTWPNCDICILSSMIFE